MRIELPSGNWVELRDADSLKRRDRKALFAGSPAYDDPVAFGWVISDRILALLVTAWSFDAPLPPSSEFLDDLPLGDDAVLTAAIDDARERLITDFTPKIKQNGQLDPSTPFLPSKP